MSRKRILMQTNQKLHKFKAKLVNAIEQQNQLKQTVPFENHQQQKWNKLRIL